MIKINLLAEKKQGKVKASTAMSVEGLGSSQNIVLAGLLVLGAAVAGIWWYTLSSETSNLRTEHVQADAELERLTEIRKKGDEYKSQKELLERKINLITELKKKQAVPVHILDQVSKNLPDFLWLESMSASNNLININGKATTYNAVSNFYGNLTGSGYFADVTLGRTFEVPEGVSFSLTCKFAAGAASQEAESPQG